VTGEDAGRHVGGAGCGALGQSRRCVRALLVGSVVLLAVDEATAELTFDDALLASAMAARGLRPQPHVWGRSVEPGATVIIRSTWDFVERPAEFSAWLEHLDLQRAIVHNPTRLLRWNAHKGYLIDLACRGVPVVETSGDVGIEAHLDRLVAYEDAVVQPFMASVTTSGETSVMAIDGRPIDAVIKRPQSGEWRVQAEFGGTAELTELTAELRLITRRALTVVQPTPTYARVDVVRDERGELRVLELELVEPELFFRLSPMLAERFAAHIHDTMTPHQ
jgi:hypothetical protein